MQKLAEIRTRILVDAREVDLMRWFSSIFLVGSIFIVRRGGFETIAPASRARMLSHLLRRCQDSSVVRFLCIDPMVSGSSTLTVSFYLE